MALEEEDEAGILCRRDVMKSRFIISPSSTSTLLSSGIEHSAFKMFHLDKTTIKFS